MLFPKIVTAFPLVSINMMEGPMVSNELNKVIVPPVVNWITLPGIPAVFASMIAWRREPAPESLVVETG
jgi:hypothetical protein